MMLALIGATTGMAFAADRIQYVGKHPSLKIHWVEYEGSSVKVNYTVTVDVESMIMVLEVRNPDPNDPLARSPLGKTPKYRNRETSIKKGKMYTAHFSMLANLPPVKRVMVDLEDVVLKKTK